MHIAGSPQQAKSLTLITQSKRDNPANASPATLASDAHSVISLTDPTSVFLDTYVRYIAYTWFQIYPATVADSQPERPGHDPCFVCFECKKVRRFRESKHWPLHVWLVFGAYSRHIIRYKLNTVYPATQPVQFNTTSNMIIVLVCPLANLLHCWTNPTTLHRLIVSCNIFVFTITRWCFGKRCYAKTSCCSANVFISILNLQTGCLVDLPTPVENPARLRTHQFYIPQQPAEGKVFGIHKCVLVIALVNMLVHSAAKFTHPVLRSRI